MQFIGILTTYACEWRVGSYKTEELFHPVLHELSEDPSSGAAAQKHLRQQVTANIIFTSLELRPQ